MFLIFDFAKELEKYGLDEETFEQALSDIDKKMSGIEDIDWTEIVSRYDIKCSPETIRKANGSIFGSFFISQYREYKKSKNISGLKDLLGEQYVIKQQIKSDRSKLSRLKREFIPAITVSEELQDIQKRNNFKVDLPDYIYANVLDSENGYCMICNISDLHIGYMIKNCNGNHYDWETANRRINEYIAECKKLINLYDIKNVYIVNTGDIVEHCYMRDTQDTACEFLLSEQINRAIEIIWKLIINLAENCNITYGAVAGNHDRMSGDKKKNYENDNVNIIINQQISNYIELSNSEKLKVISNKENTSELVLDINSLKCKFIHGDSVPKFDRTTMSNMISTDNEFYDLLFVGHYHNFSVSSENHGRYIIHTGCLSGYNDYSKKFYCTSQASQTICILGNKKVELIKDVILN